MAAVVSSLVTAQGTAAITVNSSGAASNVSMFSINPVTTNLVISALTPSSAQAGGAGFTLTVNGSGFTTNSRILWNGTPVSTIFWSSTQLTGTLSAAFIATQGTAAVSVNNNVTVSNSATFTIIPATSNPLMISNISPSSTPAGGTGLTLTVNGSGFTAASRILWNGTPLSTIFGSSTQLIGVIGANLLTTPGTVTIMVDNNGTVSNASGFTISAAFSRRGGA